MISGTDSIRVIDVLYRVSSRPQELEGDSLFNQRRTVEDEWATPRGIVVRHRVEVAESGRSALRLHGAGFVFSRRLEYAKLILDYQKNGDLPDAVCVDWSDRWSRNTLEFEGIIQAFQHLGIRLLAIGDGIDLTDPKQHLVASIKSAVAQEQVRAMSEKLKEYRRSRRERGRWQGGAICDGYRTHIPGCPGLVERTREGADGVERAFKVRSCNCPVDVLRRDPAREHIIKAVFELLLTSPLSWQAMADELNARGHRARSGRKFSWHNLYRIGENPHYAGIMATNRFAYPAMRSKKLRPLSEQDLRPANGAIVDPYIAEEDFWHIQRERFQSAARHIPRSKRGAHNELMGLMYCPQCERPMRTHHSRSGSRKKLKKIPKASVYVYCKQGRDRTDVSCDFSIRTNVARISPNLIEMLSNIVSMSDEAIAEAMTLSESKGSLNKLRREASRLEADIAEAEETRRFLMRERANGRLSENEYERDLFANRSETEARRSRLREVNQLTKRDRPILTMAKVRETISWLAANWKQATAMEKAEALRLLVKKVTIEPEGATKILEYGPGLLGLESLRARDPHDRKRDVIRHAGAL